MNGLMTGPGASNKASVQSLSHFSKFLLWLVFSIVGEGTSLKSEIKPYYFTKRMVPRVHRSQFKTSYMSLPYHASICHCCICLNISPIPLS